MTNAKLFTVFGLVKSHEDVIMGSITDKGVYINTPPNSPSIKRALNSLIRDRVITRNDPVYGGLDQYGTVAECLS